jgi:hypothetical protein
VVDLEGMELELVVAPGENRTVSPAWDLFTVEGKVTVPDGFDPADVRVTLEWADGPVSTTQVGGDGEYTLSDVPPGRYLLTFWAPGLRLHEVRYLLVEENRVVDADMDEASSAEEVSFDRDSYQTCIGLYLLVSVIVLVAGLQALRGRAYTFTVFGSIMGIFLGLMGSWGTWPSPVCFSSILSFVALVLIVRSKAAFAKDTLD